MECHMVRVKLIAQKYFEAIHALPPRKPPPYSSLMSHPLLASASIASSQQTHCTHRCTQKPTTTTTTTTTTPTPTQHHHHHHNSNNPQPPTYLYLTWSSSSAFFRVSSTPASSSLCRAFSSSPYAPYCPMTCQKRKSASIPRKIRQPHRRGQSSFPENQPIVPRIRILKCVSLKGLLSGSCAGSHGTSIWRRKHTCPRTIHSR